MSLEYAGVTELRPLLGVTFILVIMRVMVTPTLLIHGILQLFAILEVSVLYEVFIGGY